MESELGQNPVLLRPGFRVRDVRKVDREAVLAMTAHTWEFGDYIEWVFEDWVADTRGRFVAVEHIESGQLAAIDKMTFLSDHEAWFEGLRVAQEFRGHGLASSLQTFMLNKARQAGAKKVRLLTSISNQAVQRMAYRDGFTLKATVRFWKWIAPVAPDRYESKGNEQTTILVTATVEQAEALYHWWQRSSAYRTGGLGHRNWSFSETSADEWVQAASESRLFVAAGAAEWHLPPFVALVKSQTTADGTLLWTVTATGGLGNQWKLLFAGLVANARFQGVGEVNGLFPRDPDIEAALREAIFSPDEDDEPLCLFELRLDQSGISNKPT